MAHITQWLNHPFAQDWIMMLLHSLWQGAVLAVILYGLLKHPNLSQPNTRYTISLSLLFVLLVSLCVTLAVLRLDKPKHSPEIQSQTLPSIATNKPPSIIPSVNNKVSVTPHTATLPWQAWALGIWCLGVCVMLTRMIGLLFGIHGLIRQSVTVQTPAVLDLIESLKTKLHVTQRILVVTGQHILSPGVIGCIRPILLLPVSVTTGIPSNDLEAILLHELTHIRRYDYLVNFFQMMIEALLFFNPAVWWINRQIRLEREACCDAAAIEHHGQRLRYAELLVQWSKHDQPYNQVAAIAGFSCDHKRSLTERIKRIALPNHAPQVHLSLLSTLGLFILSSILLAVLWMTTDTAVVFAAKILTPEERIEQMEELEQTYGESQYPRPETVPEKKKTLVTGTITTWNGRALPDDCKLRGVMVNDISQSHHDLSIQENGGFFINAYGRVYFAVYSSQYAPAFLGPIQAEPNHPVDGLSIILKKRQTAQIRIVDHETGSPLEAVELTGGYRYYPNGYSYMLNMTTDANGFVELAYTDEACVILKASEPGYEDRLFDNIILSQDTPVTLDMVRARPTTGVVLSQETGEPIPNAEIRIQGFSGDTDQCYSQDQGPIIETTDTNGRFELTTLRKDTVYYLAVTAPNFSHAITDRVRAGQQDLKVSLPPFPAIRGRITGPLKRLPHEDGHPVIHYSCGFRFRTEDGHGHSHMGSGQQALVTLEDDQATFVLTEIWGNYLWINHKRYDIETLYKEPLIVDLSDKIAPDGLPYNKRQIVIDFNVPTDCPPPSGSIQVNYTDPNSSKSLRNYGIKSIDQGHVTFDMYTPGKISVGLADTVGYWFKEINGHDVPRGEEPYHLTLNTIPAGTIYGQVLEANGSDANNVLVSVSVIEKSPQLPKDAPFLNVDGKNSASASELETTFNITPLPLGGTYALVIRRNNLIVESGPIQLTEQHPIHEVRTQLPKGVAMSGQVVDVNGTPISNIPYQLNYDAKYGGGFTHTGLKTKSDGKFSLGRVNFDAPGTFSLILNCRHTFRKATVPILDTTSPIAVTLERGALATGRILDRDTGWPIPNVEVSAWYYENGESERLKSEGRTDNQGRFRFSNMKPGRTYHLSISECRGDVDVTAGKSTDLEIPVTPYAWSRLNPLQPQ